MATFDDYDGVWFTVQAIRLFHEEITDDIAFLIIDNHPEGAAAPSLQDLEYTVPHLRYVPFAGFRGTAVRELIFREAHADIVCCIDSHVLLQAGALAALIRWFDAHPASRDLIQGPLLNDTLVGPSATHFASVWSAGMYGQWALDHRAVGRNARPFQIDMQGLGLFACRREAWPGLNPRFRGFGGEEGYVHEKVRRAGGRTICHPLLGWVHRFGRPLGAPYDPSWHERLRNYLIGWHELGWDTAAIETHFREEFEKMGAGSEFERVLERTISETRSPFSYFDGIFCLNLDVDTRRWADTRRRLRRLDIDWQTERFPALATPDDPHRGCAISFRRMVAEAWRRGYEHLLILEDDVVFIDDAMTVMKIVVAELAEIEWDLCYLGAWVWSQTFPFLEGSSVLQACGPVTGGHAVAIHRRAYKQILSDIPADTAEFHWWLRKWVASDQYLWRRVADGTFRALITWPRVASQPVCLAYDEADRGLADRYIV